MHRRGTRPPRPPPPGPSGRHARLFCSPFGGPPLSLGRTARGCRVKHESQASVDPHEDLPEHHSEGSERAATDAEITAQTCPTPLWECFGVGAALDLGWHKKCRSLRLQHVSNHKALAPSKTSVDQSVYRVCSDLWNPLFRRTLTPKTSSGRTSQTMLREWPEHSLTSLLRLLLGGDLLPQTDRRDWWNQSPEVHFPRHGILLDQCSAHGPGTPSPRNCEPSNLGQTRSM